MELWGIFSQVDERSIEGRYRELRRVGTAIEIYHSLWGVFRDDRTRSGIGEERKPRREKGKTRWRLSAELQRLPEMKDDARIEFLARPFAAKNLSDVKLQRSAAAAAAEKASGLGSRYLAAQAYWQECIALHALGVLQKAMEACGRSSRCGSSCVGD